MDEVKKAQSFDIHKISNKHKKKHWKVCSEEGK